MESALCIVLSLCVLSFLRGSTLTELTAGKSEFLLHLQQQSLAQEDTREVEMVKGKKDDVKLDKEVDDNKEIIIVDNDA